MGSRKLQNIYPIRPGSGWWCHVTWSEINAPTVSHRGVSKKSDTSITNRKNKVQFSDADTRLTAKSYYPSAKMCLREILLTAWEAIAALQCNEAAGREGQCGDGPEQSPAGWMFPVPGSLHHQPHHAPTLAILHRLINCVLRPHHASEPHRLDQCVGLTDFNSFSQAVKATIKKLVVPLYTSR